MPICGANEVCSKIDLYGTPWIERQCRCPQLKQHYRDDNEKNQVLNTRNRHAILHNLRLGDLSRDMYEFEREHIKNFLMKLGMLHDIDDNSMKTDDYYANDADADDYDYSGEDHAYSSHNNLIKNHHQHHNHHHRSSDNEAIAIVKMTKIRHHNSHAHSSSHCSNAISSNDGYTIADKTRLYKVCEPVQKLPLCR